MEKAICPNKTEPKLLRFATPEKQNVKIATQSKIICDICEGPKDVNSFCTHCEGTLCDKCKIKHKDGRISRHHRVITISRKMFTRPTTPLGSEHVTNKGTTRPSSGKTAQDSRSGPNIRKAGSALVDKKQVISRTSTLSTPPNKKIDDAKTVHVSRPATCTEKPKVPRTITRSASAKTSNDTRTTSGSVGIVSAPCKSHPGKAETIYCNQCRIACCAECAKVNHVKHDMVQLVKKMEIFNKELQKYTTQLETSILKKFKGELVKADQDLKSYEKSSINTKKDLEMDYRNIKEQMEDLYAQYLRQFDQRIQKDKYRILERKNMVEKNILDVSTLIQLCKTNFSSTNPAALEFENKCPKLESFKLPHYTKPKPPTYHPIQSMDKKQTGGHTTGGIGKGAKQTQRGVGYHGYTDGETCDACGGKLREWEHPLSRHTVMFCPRCILL